MKEKEYVTIKNFDRTIRNGGKLKLIEQQIIILEWFLKDHVTLKTGEVEKMLKIHRNKLHFNILF